MKMDEDAVVQSIGEIIAPLRRSKQWSTPQNVVEVENQESSPLPPLSLPSPSPPHSSKLYHDVQWSHEHRQLVPKRNSSARV